MRTEPGAEPEAILVLKTLGAPQRRLLRGRRGRRLTEAEPEPVPTSRATHIDPVAFPSRQEAESWLADLRGDADLAHARVAEALLVLSRALQAHRAAHADPYTWDVTAKSALVTRLGFGAGEAVAEGRYADAYQLSPERARTKRSMEAPEERFAALLGAREALLPGEDLVLRARADLDAARTRQAALQARIALESLLTEIGGDLGPERQAGLDADRGPVGEAANAALRGGLGTAAAEDVAGSVARMEAALRIRRLGSAS